MSRGDEDISHHRHGPVKRSTYNLKLCQKAVMGIGRISPSMYWARCRWSDPLPTTSNSPCKSFIAAGRNPLNPPTAPSPPLPRRDWGGHASTLNPQHGQTGVALEWPALPNGLLTPHHLLPSSIPHPESPLNLRSLSLPAERKATRPAQPQGGVKSSRARGSNASAVCSKQKYS